MDDAEVTHTEIVERIAASEGLRTDGVKPLVDSSTGQSVGEVATISGMNIDKAVGVDLTIDDDGDPLWSRSFYVFARSLALVPHLAMEWSKRRGDDGDRTRVLVDLLPRIDLAVNLEYVDEIYGPLTDVVAEARAIDGARLEAIHPRRAVALSPWRLSLSVPDEEVAALGPVIQHYVDRWIAVNTGGVGSPVDPLASDQSRLVQHDRFHRNTLFDPDSDPSWERIDRILGPDAAAELRLTLRSQRER